MLSLITSHIWFLTPYIHYHASIYTYLCFSILDLQAQRMLNHANCDRTFTRPYSIIYASTEKRTGSYQVIALKYYVRQYALMSARTPTRFWRICERVKSAYVYLLLSARRIGLD